MARPRFLSSFSPYRILLIILCLVVGVLLILRFTRPSKSELAEYVPDNALGYVAVDDPPAMVRELTASSSWRNLASVYRIPEKLTAAGWVGTISKWTGLGSPRTLLFARGQFAVVVTGIEVRGEEVRPRWTLIVKANTSQSSITEYVRENFRALALKGYGSPLSSTSEYAGIPISILSAPNGGRQLLLAQTGDVSIISNDPSGMQACIDTSLKRRASISSNPLWSKARNGDADAADIFAFAGGEGVGRLSQFFAHIMGGRLLEGTPLAGMLEGLLAEISTSTVEGMSYTARFNSAGVNDKYILYCKSQVSQSLRASLASSTDIKPEQSSLVKMVSNSATSISLIRVAQPAAALTSMEQVIASNIGAAQTFIFHRFMSSAKKSLLGIEPGDDGTKVLGRQIASATFKLNDGESQRAWLIEGGEGKALSNAAETLLKQQGGSSGRDKLNNFDFRYSRNGDHAFAVGPGLLVLGSKETVRRLLTPGGQSFVERTGFVDAASSVPANAFWVSFSDITEESDQMMRSLARRAKSMPAAGIQEALGKLPLSVGTAMADESGITIESKSPFGYLPQLLNFLETII